MTIKGLISALTEQEDLNFLLTNRIPRAAVTRFMGWFSKIENPVVRDLSIACWRLFSDLDLSEAKKSEFKSLHDCFTRELRPGLRTVQHVGFTVSIRAAREAWAAGFHDAHVTPRGIHATQRLGLVPLVYTVNDERRMRDLAAAGVAGIFTDRPERALRLFGAHPL